MSALARIQTSINLHTHHTPRRAQGGESAGRTTGEAKFIRSTHPHPLLRPCYLSVGVPHPSAAGLCSLAFILPPHPPSPPQLPPHNALLIVINNPACSASSRVARSRSESSSFTASALNQPSSSSFSSDFACQ